VIALFLITRLLLAQTLHGAARTAPPPMPYQRGLRIGQSLCGRPGGLKERRAA